MSDQGISAYLATYDERYDAESRMVSERLKGPGYHTTLPAGTVVHSTRLALDYATALLATGQPAKAAGTIDAVLALQDTEPASHTYGIWPWFLEESLAQMSPPDWNWADFCGARLLVILQGYGGYLPAASIQRIRTAVGHAAQAIVRRNMGPHYTNIAIMGGTVTAAAGEALDDGALLVFGRTKLQRMVEYTKAQGSFNEYNSPTYTMVALEECERTLHLVTDAATRTAAEWLLAHAWQIIAEHWHPATGQWAGPHSRAYSDRLSATTVQRLSERLGMTLPLHPGCGEGTGSFEPVPPIPCDPRWRQRFLALPEPRLELRRRFVAKPGQEVVGTTWFDGDGCLGSVNSGTFWNQCRPLIAYWRSDAEPAAVFRPRFLHDGRDFATAVIENEQRGQRVSSRVRLQEGLGDFHCHLDKPENGCFRAEDFRLRFELTAQGASAQEIGAGAYALRAGDWEIRLNMGHALVNGVDCRAEIIADEKFAAVDFIVYHAASRAYGFPELGTVDFAFTTELLHRSRAASPAG